LRVRTHSQISCTFLRERSQEIVFATVQTHRTAQLLRVAPKPVSPASAAKRSVIAGANQSRQLAFFAMQNASGASREFAIAEKSKHSRKLS
jgi:hypothetical protein